VLLDRSSLLTTHQALRAIAIVAVGRGDHHNVSGVLDISSIVLGERRHVSLLIERNPAPHPMLPDSNSVCDQRRTLVVMSQSAFDRSNRVDAAVLVSTLQIIGGA